MGRCGHAELLPAATRERSLEAGGLASALPNVHQATRDDAHHVVEKTIPRHDDVDAWCALCPRLDGDVVDATYRGRALIPSTPEGVKVVLSDQHSRCLLHQAGVQWTQNPVGAPPFEWVGRRTDEDSIAISLPQWIASRIEAVGHQCGPEHRDGLRE